MAIQTSYTERQRRGVHGMINNMVDRNVVTRVIESVGGVGSGIAVSQGANEDGCIVGGTAVGFVGITVKDVTINNPTAPDVYPAKTNVGVLTKGELFITAPATIVTGDPVYFVPGTGALTNVSAGNILIAGARWKFGVASGALGIVQLGIQR